MKTKLPDFPITVSGAAAVAQMDGEEIGLHVFGGRTKSAGDFTTTFYPHVFRNRPTFGYWEQKQDMELPQAVASAAPVGASHIVLAGGDSGETFNKAEQVIHAMQNGDENARQLRDSLWMNHSGFNSKIWV